MMISIHGPRRIALRIHLLCALLALMTNGFAARSANAQEAVGALRLERIACVPSEGGEIIGLGFVHGGKEMVTLGDDGGLVIWDFAALRPIGEFPAVNGATKFAAHPDLPFFAVAIDSGLVIHDMLTGERETIPVDHSIIDMKWSPQGKWLLLLLRDGFKEYPIVLARIIHEPTLQHARIALWASSDVS